MSADEYLQGYLEAMKQRPEFHELKKTAIKKELDIALHEFNKMQSFFDGVLLATKALNQPCARLERLVR